MDGKLEKVVKWRVTTDDSYEPPGLTSRNAGMDKGAWVGGDLPHVRDLAEAVAIVKSIAKGMGLRAREIEYEKIALWALDLSDAYRALACARSEWWLQHFIWLDGVRLDMRCVFGSAHLVGFFERVTSFVLQVAQRRISEYDKGHPYKAGRREWQRWRESELGASQSPAWSTIYLDDGFGLSVHGAGEPLRGRAPADPLVRISFTTEPRGGVRMWSFVDKSRSEIHLAIVKVRAPLLRTRPAPA